MFRPAALVAVLVSSLTVACAQSPTARSTSSISFEVDADPSGQAARLTCKKASTGECVVWVGDAASPDHRVLHIAANTSVELADDGKGRSLCATAVESGLSWPDCVKSPKGGSLDKSGSIDYFFW
jgi:hypothetical protein